MRPLLLWLVACRPPVPADTDPADTGDGVFVCEGEEARFGAGPPLAAYAAGPGDLWVGGSASFRHLTTSGAEDRTWDGGTVSAIGGADGVVWALTGEAAHRWADGARTDVAAPEDRDFRDLHVDGADAIVVLASAMPCGDCSGPYPSSLLRWDGSAWTEELLPEAAWGAQALWVGEGDDALVAGPSGLLAVRDGGGWRALASGTAEDLLDVTRDGTGGIVAVGTGGVVVQGPEDALVAASVATGEIRAVLVDDDGAVWAAGRDGGTRGWLLVDDGAGFREVASAGGGFWALAEAGDVYAAGGDASEHVVVAGTADGVSPWWTEVPVPRIDAIAPSGPGWFADESSLGQWDDAGPRAVVPKAGRGLDAVGASSAEVLAVERTAVHTWDGASLTTTTLGDWDAVVLGAVAVAEDGTALVGGMTDGPDEARLAALWSREGGVWTPFPTDGLPDGLVTGAWTGGAGELLVVAYGTLARWDGDRWTPLAEVQNDGLWARATDDAWIATYEGLVHWDGVEATVVPGSPAPVYAVAGDDDAVYVLASWDDPALWRWDGARWQRLVEGPYATLGVGPEGVVTLGSGITGWRGTCAAQ